MIQNIIDHINAKLVDLNGFDQQRIIGLCENIEEPKNDSEEIAIYPGLYSGHDTVKFITTNDFKSGVIWHMKNGTADISEQDRMSTRSVIQQYEIPLKLYAITNRAIIGDKTDAADKLAANIQNTINERNANQLAQDLGFIRIQVEATEYSTDKSELDHVFRGVDITNLKRYDIIYCSITYRIFVLGRQQCFVNFTC